jgi:hypothetical protein
MDGMGRASMIMTGVTAVSGAAMTVAAVTVAAVTVPVSGMPVTCVRRVCETAQRHDAETNTPERQAERVGVHGL